MIASLKMTKHTVCDSFFKDDQAYRVCNSFFKDDQAYRQCAIASLTLSGPLSQIRDTRVRQLRPLSRIRDSGNFNRKTVVTI